METHPITSYPYRWIPIVAAGILLAIAQTALIRCYACTDWLPALIDGVTTIGWLMTLAYLAWFIVGTISLSKTNVITFAAGTAFWLTGSFIVYDMMERIAGLTYIPFATTIPFRLLFGVPAWTAVLLWYRLHTITEASPIEAEDIPTTAEEKAEKPEATTGDEQPQEECLDRITVKDGSRIHLIDVNEILYIQACGDYATLITSTGEYIKEQTMKYLEAHLPAANFVRIHRSNIVNVAQISRLELFGKETYQLILKNGVKLRVSLSGYRLLKERLGI